MQFLLVANKSYSVVLSRFVALPESRSVNIFILLSQFVLPPCVIKATFQATPCGLVKIVAGFNHLTLLD